MKIAMIMLAAGNSRRFGANKLLYEIDGIPMYRHVLEQLDDTKKKISIRNIQILQRIIIMIIIMIIIQILFS